jgi:hypothetical protein
VVIALADVTAAERLVAQVGPEQAPRLRSWVRTEARKQSSADIGDELRALRALRARRDPAALAAAEAAVQRAGARGELLAEVGLARLASEGPRSAQPDFDRARVALERETGHPASAFTLASVLPEFETLSWTPDGRELWLWGGGSRPRAVVLDSETWEPVWQLDSDSRSCASVPLAKGAGFARCDGIFARDGRRLFALPEMNPSAQMPLAALKSESRLLIAVRESEHRSRLAWLDPTTGLAERLDLPSVDHLVALGASSTNDWFFIESLAGVDVIARPSLQRLLRIKASAAQPLDGERIAVVSPTGGLEVWQLRPPKRIARHYLPAIVVPHGPSIGSTYYRGASTERLILQHLATEWSWSFEENPLVSPGLGLHETPDEMPGQTLREVAVASDQRSAGELRRDDRLDFDELQITSSAGAVLSATSAAKLVSFVVSPNGARIAINIANKSLTLMDVAAGAITGALEFVHIRRLAAFDDEHVVIELPFESLLIDLRDGSQHPFALPRGEHFFARGSSGGFVTTGFDGQASSFDATGKLLRSFNSLAPSALSPSGAWLLLRGRDRLALASTSQGTRALLLDVDPSVEAWRFSRDERWLVTLGPSGLVLWETASGQKSKLAERAKLGKVDAIDFDCGDDAVVLAGDGGPRAFRLASGEAVAAPTPDFHAGPAIVWKLRSRALNAFRGTDSAWLGAVTFSGNGKTGVVVSAAGETEFLGGEPDAPPRCAFGNVLVAWPVCSDTVLVPRLLRRFSRDAANLRALEDR